MKRATKIKYNGTSETNISDALNPDIKPLTGKPVLPNILIYVKETQCIRNFTMLSSQYSGKTKIDIAFYRVWVFNSCSIYWPALLRQKQKKNKKTSSSVAGIKADLAPLLLLKLPRNLFTVKMLLNGSHRYLYGINVTKHVKIVLKRMIKHLYSKPQKTSWHCNV